MMEKVNIQVNPKKTLKKYEKRRIEKLKSNIDLIIYSFSF